MVNNLGPLWRSVRVVDGMPRAGSHYNLGTSRGPDKIGSWAGPGPRLARGWSRRCTTVPVAPPGGGGKILTPAFAFAEVDTCLSIADFYSLHEQPDVDSCRALSARRSACPVDWL